MGKNTKYIWFWAWRKLKPFLKQPRRFSEIKKYLNLRYNEQVKRIIDKWVEIGEVKKVKIKKTTFYVLVDEISYEAKIILAILKCLRNVKEEKNYVLEVVKELKNEPTTDLFKTNYFLKEVAHFLGEDHKDKNFRKKFFKSIKWIRENLKVNSTLVAFLDEFDYVFEEEIEKLKQKLDKRLLDRYRLYGIPVSMIVELKKESEKIFHEKLKEIENKLYAFSTTD